MLVILRRLAAAAWMLVFISGCASNAIDDQPVRRMSDETLERLNAVARSAVAKPGARARSGSRRKRDVAFDAIYHFDRDHTRLFNREIKTLWRDYHNNYIDNHEYHEAFTRVFVNLGVVENRDYRSADDRYLLRLDGNYRLNAASADLLQRLYPTRNYQTPDIQTVAAVDSSTNNNFNRGDLSVLDPLSVARSAQRFGLNTSALTEAVALHEAQHDVLGQVLTGSKSSIITPLLTELSAAIDNLVIFHHWREVDEFLADGVAVLRSQDGLRYATTRIVRAGPSLGFIKEPRAGESQPYRKRPHDAAALFIYRLLLRREAELSTTDSILKINAVRDSMIQQHEPGETVSSDWIRTVWLPYINHTFDPDLEQHIRDRYEAAMKRMLDVILSSESDTQLTSN